MLAKTFNSAVVQKTDVPEHRTAAAKVLPSAALQNKSPCLAAVSNADDGSIVGQNLNSSHRFSEQATCSPQLLPEKELLIRKQTKP